MGLERGMAQNIVFDIGGVLADFRALEFLADKGFDEAMSRRIIKAAVMSAYWGQFERGEISENEALAGFARTDPDIGNELYRAFSDVRGLLTMRDFAIPLVRGLKDAGYGVYYLSNYSKKAYDECADSLAFMPYMDGGVVSFEVGMTKPSPQVFRLFLDRYGLEAPSCLFVDDSATNVEAARKLGFESIVYSSHEQLMAELEEHGVVTL